MIKVDIGRAIVLRERYHTELEVMRVHAFPHFLRDWVQVISELFSSQVVTVPVQEIKLLLEIING